MGLSGEDIKRKQEQKKLLEREQELKENREKIRRLNKYGEEAFKKADAKKINKYFLLLILVGLTSIYTLYDYWKKRPYEKEIKQITAEVEVQEEQEEEEHKIETNMWIKEIHYPSRYICLKIYDKALSGIRLRSDVKSCNEYFPGKALCEKTNGYSINLECDRDNFLKEIEEK